MNVPRAGLVLVLGLSCVHVALADDPQPAHGTSAGDAAEVGGSDGPFDLERPRSGLAPQTLFEKKKESRPYWRRNLFRRFAEDQLYLVRHWWPTEIRRPSFFAPTLAAIAAGSQSAHGGFDLEAERAIQAWDVGARGSIADAATWLGDGSTAIALLGSTYLISRWRGNDHLSRATSLAAEAVADGALYSTLFKALTRRTRPSKGGTGEFFVSSPVAGQEATSFPSGHATGAFAVATVFALEYRRKRWVRWVAYGTAGMIAASRVVLGRHFPSDVVVGAVLGHSMGRMVMQRAGTDVKHRVAWHVEPLIDPVSGGVGVAFRRSW